MKFIVVAICIFSLSLSSAIEQCEKDIYETEFHTKSEKDEVLAIWYPSRGGSHNVLQLCSKQTGLPMERHCSYDRQAGHSTWDAIDKGMELVDCSVIVNNCVEETFEHAYLMKNNAIKTHKNKWPQGKIGEQVKTEEPCLLETGLPLTRKCLYNSKHYLAEWEKKDFKNIKCLQDINQDIVTYDLYNLYKDVEAKPTITDANSIGIATNLTNLLAKGETVRIPMDLDVATNILELITRKDKEPALLPQVLEVTNLLMKSDKNIVLSSNALDTPKTLLKTVDTYLDGMTNVMMPTSKCNAVPNGVQYNAKNFTSVFFINPTCSNISGIAVYSTLAHPTSAMYYDSPSNSYFRYLYLNQSLSDIAREPHLTAAAFFPQELWNSLTTEAKGKSNLEAVRFSLYRNKNFFVVQDNYERIPASVVIQISIPDYSGDLPGYLPLIFKHQQTDQQEKPQCGYYDYNTWNSSAIIETLIPNIGLCKTNRLKSFGALLGLDQMLWSQTDPLLTIVIETTLNIISVAGCILSLLGLLCIWLTAACCKEWRTQSSNKLLLNICLVLTLIMSYFLVINMPDIRDAVIDINSFYHCIAEGAFLQYIILVLFFWMLIIAILQYHRYVTVFGVARSTNAIVQFCLAAWGLPLIPTALVVWLDPTSYIPFSTKDAICYPSGRSLYFSVLLPISVIMTINIGIFVYILCSVRRSLKKFKRRDRVRKDIVAQVRLSILLFFLLGVSWVFGILAHLAESTVLSLLFCLTSTLQGFILFIYFVIIDKSARYSWLKCCCGMNYYTLEDSSMTRLTYLNSR